MTAALIALLALIGLCFGSFGNVLIYRLPSGRTIGGRSHCGHCKKPIGWFDLIPVLSYLILGGRCRRCGKRISIQYPLIEFASALIFFVAALLHSNDPTATLTTAIIGWALLLLSVIDARHKHIPDVLTAVVGAAAIVSAIDAGALLSGIMGGAVAFAWFGGQWLLSRGRWVGSGDILLSTVLGVWLGCISTIGMLLLAYILGAAWVSALLLTRSVRLRSGAQIPFGPFLAIAAVMTHAGMIDWYLRLLF